MGTLQRKRIGVRRAASAAARVCALGLLCCGAASSAGAGGADRPAASALAAAGELRDPAVRRRIVEEMSRSCLARKAEAEARARLRGLPLRGSLPGGGGWELMGFEGDTPLYYTTLNAAAAVSSGANLLWTAPFRVDGSGGTVGVWDEGSARLTHQEFGGRVATMDGAALSHHTTHVVGTICASGIVSSAVGMARNAFVQTYDWNGDIAEMVAAGASFAGEPGKINISNHSYGEGCGWVKTGTQNFTWFGVGTNAAAIDDDFGKYNTYAQEMDALACSLPYYLMFWVAGNDRGYTADYNPVSGVSTVALYPGGPTYIYDAAIHPPGDGVYRGGYDTMSYRVLAKNVMSVGSVSDATNALTGLRDLSKATRNSWSSWGPSDDGRIKPDVVANGFLLYSSTTNSDSAYRSVTGTSMACASASGTAQLLVHYYGKLFTNRWMRASTLKGLLIHTADDLDTPGPDYKTGWGLINATAAAELIRACHASPGLRGLSEGSVGTNRAVAVIPFTWDGTSPIRATLCWSDPAGAATQTGDCRQANLVNDLNLSVTAPNQTAYLPWVMPFVGNWNTNAYALAAVTGTNVTDNVEQVLIAAPPAAGVYRATVSFSGTLTNGVQSFSLILSGTACSRSTALSVR